MTHNSDLCTSIKTRIKTRMKTPTHLNSKGNEIILQCSVNARSCFSLSSHRRYMCCHYQCSLHHIYANQVTNDDVHQSSKNIRSSSGLAREKVGDLPLNMYSILQSNNIQSISWVVVCSFPQGHQSKWVPKLSMV